ncbi:MAG: metallophosphoesterase [Planctomycetes bacterium]|nr:metallophosphoesterase [Planctomycetota bacterium]MCB9870329.1 metallophosphoesterase [Planctomycetota bacterium]MCB9888092.1 metallophosphoesterase [Planctomycetota bacterium]
MRRVFVGDIQGCLEQLDALLEEIGFQRGVDVLHPVGDMVNKGPDSLGVLARLRELKAFPVLGNHDLAFLERGRVTEPRLAEWLRAQPIVRVLDDVIMVHAGLHPRWGERELRRLSRADIDFAVNVRYCDAKGNRPASDWPPPGPPFRPWHEFYHGSKRVVFGHWARQGLLVRPHALGLDTGCVYGGELTAWIAEEDRLVAVPGWQR